MYFRSDGVEFEAEECGGGDGISRFFLCGSGWERRRRRPDNQKLVSNFLCLNDEHISVCIHYSVLQELGWSGIKHNCNLIVFWVYIH